MHIFFRDRAPSSCPPHTLRGVCPFSGIVCALYPFTLVQAEVDPPDSESYLNAAVSEAVFDEGGKWTIVRWNDASHIKGVSTQSFSIDGK